MTWGLPVNFFLRWIYQKSDVEFKPGFISAMGLASVRTALLAFALCTKSAIVSLAPRPRARGLK